MNFFILFFLFFNFSHASDVCKDVSDYVLECYRDWKSGKIKNCTQFRKNLSDKKLIKLYKKACSYGCMSESLYEANQMAEIIFKECKKIIHR